MKVLFLYPNLRGFNMFPPSIAILSAILKRDGFEVELFDTTYWNIPGEEDFNSDKAKEKNLNVRPFDFAERQVSLHTTNVYEDFDKKVQSFSPDLIAVSASEDLFPTAIGLLAAVRHHQIPTILGGVFSTFAPKLCLSYAEIDMVCIGEGEICLLELCRRIRDRKSYDDVPNLWLRKSGDSIIQNPPAPPVKMEENPLPDIGIFEEARLYRPMAGKIYRMLPVETHRGCPFKCAFCNSPDQDRLYQQELDTLFFRKKPLAAVQEEIIYYRDVWKAEYFYFWADTFFAYTEKEFDEFCEMYSDFKIPFWVQTRPETITERRLQRLLDVGLNRMALGIEHGDAEFRNRIVNRKINNEKLVEAFQVLNGLNVEFSVNNIIGFPTETRELAMKTVELNRQIEADNFNCYSFSPFHGTPLREMAENLGYITPEEITRSIARDSILDMPQFRRHEVEGLRRCFVMYITMPRERWPEIQKAEAMTPAGDAIWDSLREEWLEQMYSA